VGDGARGRPVAGAGGFRVAAAVELTGLLWLGALGAVLTLIAVAEPARGDSHWAWVMVGVGLIVAAAGAFIQRARIISAG